VKLATVRTAGGTQAVRVDDDAAVELGAPDLGVFLSRPDWRAEAAAADGARHDLAALDYAPVVPRPEKIICVVALTAEALDAAMADLPGAVWKAEVRSALGRTIPAAEVPWMRVREVWLHALDLDTGAQPGDLPAPVVDTLLDDVTGVFGTRTDGPRLELTPTDRDRTWRVGDGGIRVAGPAADLLAWLTGRSRGDGLTCDADLPVPGRWL
jgi:uncharacterized protein (TIGR03083 family)